MDIEKLSKVLVAVAAGKTAEQIKEHLSAVIARMPSDWQKKAEPLVERALAAGAGQADLLELREFFQDFEGRFIRTIKEASGPLQAERDGIHVDGGLAL